MPTQSSWYLQDRIVLVRSIGNMSTDEMLADDRALVTDFLNKTPADKVHINFDNTKATGSPPIWAFRKLKFHKHPKTGWTVAFGGNKFVNFMASIAAQLANCHLRMFNTLDECLAYLKQIDESLVELLSVDPVEKSL